MQIDPIFFKTRGNNWYFFSPSYNKVILCHPSIKYFFEKKYIGEKLRNVDCNRPGHDIFDDGLKLTKNAIKHYYEKYQFFLNNGFFESVDIKKKLSNRISSDIIKNTFATTSSVCFEVSENCNLQCLYCACGEMYSNVSKRKSRIGDPDLAIKFLLYLNKIKSEYNNGEIKNEFNLGFYGGEPLLNFSFIQEVVSFAKQLSLEGNSRFDFSMTTNGVLLDKYMEFLVANNFKLTISLDGDSKNNGYRVFQDGNPSFEIIFDNLARLRKKYPDYFDNRVSFNAVLHQKNSIDEIYKYFKLNFNKMPFFSEVSPFWINDSCKDKFKEMYKNSNSDLKKSKHYCEIEKDMFWMLPNIKSLKMFVQMYSGSSYKTYLNLFAEKNSSDFKTYPSGTCIPFSKRIFLTVDGKLLPCENIGNHNYFGCIEKDSVEIDFEQVAERFNANLDRLSQCNNCYNALKCENCMYYFLSPNNVGNCVYYMDREKYSKLLAERFSIFESKPSLYYKLLLERERNE